MQLTGSSRFRPQSGNALRVLSFVMALALVGGAGAVYGQQSVYGPRAPQNAGFLRVVNGSYAAEEITLRVGATALGPIAPGTIGPYRTVSPGVYLLRLQGHTAEVIVRPGEYQSLVVVPEDLLVFSDTVHDDPARAQLVLYNTVKTAIDLITLPGRQPVLTGVAPGSSGTVAVNAVTVTLGVRNGEDLFPLSGATVLERGQSTGIFLTEQRSGLTVLTGNARVEPGDS